MRLNFWSRYDGLTFFETALAAYGPMGVTGGKGGKGDVILMGESFFVAPELHMDVGAKLAVIGSMICETCHTCSSPNATFPNGNRPQCVYQDLVPAGGSLNASLGLGESFCKEICYSYECAVGIPKLAQTPHRVCIGM